MREIYLESNPEGWRLFSRRRRQRAFRAVERRIWRRDHNTCQFCGFQARAYQEVVNIDHNYRNNATTNLVTACCFCAQCFFVGSIAGEHTEGANRIIYLPEMSQADLNNLCRVFFVAIEGHSVYADTATSLYQSLRHRSTKVEDIFGNSADDSVVFGRALTDSGASVHHNRFDVLASMRFLPSRARFQKQISYWLHNELSTLPWYEVMGE